MGLLFVLAMVKAKDMPENKKNTVYK